MLLSDITVHNIIRYKIIPRKVFFKKVERHFLYSIEELQELEDKRMKGIDVN